MRASELYSYFERVEDLEVLDAADIKAATQLISALAQSIRMVGRPPPQKPQKCDECGRNTLTVSHDRKYAHCFRCGNHSPASEDVCSAATP